MILSNNNKSSFISNRPFSTRAAAVVSTKQYEWMDLTKRPKKLKPYILKRRRDKLKTYVGSEKNIRHSPWRLNLVCQMVKNLSLEQALVQLQFSNKKAATIVSKVLQRTSNLADIRDCLPPSRLEVAECFATHGSHLKRLKIMGRGK
jgi:large subunit ribosomal protein L22